MSADRNAASPVGMMQARARARGVAGFTLLEVVVAVAIAALALVALFQAGSAGLLTVNDATRVEEAVDRAQSHLAAFVGTGLITAGESEGDDGDGYRWRLSSRQAAVQPLATGPSDVSMILYEVSVVVSWGGRARDHSVELQTERIRTVGAAP